MQADRDAPPLTSTVAITRELGRRYGMVLVLLLATVGIAIAAPSSGWVGILVAVLQLATLILTLGLVGISRTAIIVAVLLSAAGVAASLAAAAERGLSSNVADTIGVFLVPFAALSVARAIGREVRRTGISLQTVFGLIALYLLIGITFATFYTLLDRIDPPFFAQLTGQATRSEAYYFSFVTLITLGYGDFTAGENLGRALAVLEGLIGQIYLVTVVALSVSALGGSRHRG